MKVRHLVRSALVVGSLALAVPAQAQQPRITNGRLAPQATGVSLDRTFRGLVSAQNDPGWIGYSVPVVSGERRMCCCGNGDGTWISDGVVFTNGRGCGGCGLEPADTSGGTARAGGAATAPSGPVRLEAPESLVVLYRVEQRAVQKIRVFSPDCELDAGGRTIQWLDGVKPAESVALLSTFVSREDRKSDRLTDSAITAIALHRDGEADAELERLAASGAPEFVRKKVLFWMGNARGRRGFETVRRIAREDASDEVRKSAMFALSQSQEPEAIPTLVQLARQDGSPKVRGEAIFWLGQKAGQKAAAAITATIEQDPDTEVKKKAVFALSQLPRDEGIPLLIGVAKTNKNPAVRKQAMFWLGQSKDPRALEFFAQVLAK